MPFSKIDDSRSVVFRMRHITARLGVLEKRIRASCREAKARHASSTCAQLEEALRAHDCGAAWEHCRLLAGHSRRSVKPRAAPHPPPLPEKALDPGALEAHMKKVFWSDILACTATVFSVSHPGSEFISQWSLCRTRDASETVAEDGEWKGDDDMVGSYGASQVPLGQCGPTHI